jgi:hypothetical protein
LLKLNLFYFKLKREKEEDYEVTRILSSKGYHLKDREEEIIEKYEIYRDII